MTATPTMADGTTKIASLSPETKTVLHQSILLYLHRCGFTRTFKRFQSEAQIQNDTWKGSSANLEDIYNKYINACRQTEDPVVDSETKAKKKKNKRDLASGDEIKEIKSDALKKPVDDTVNNLEVNESKKKTKDKKKKNRHEVFPEENGDVNPKKSSKKRKRLSSDENGHQSNKMETNQTIEEPPKQDDAVEIEAHGNEKPEIDGVEKSGSEKFGKKQRVGSAEPKTINAFQRVKIDQVEFAHEKLQDNSYWAKDGADIGYGAKAQEVLGQVKGRDFRHEKTKKKRGSYRGGQIDLQSHSIKFNYSDEE
ncbi:hypothetical protein R6Q59_013189 [Mikania micrantha]|uniref:Uncharacterized protein n=1 Tax=Mikania micrantha TaxID=192012 RepID=A0A5N6LPK0_9ASTR|nr:hypothetical protein E3N88_41140 [Mikania micrantha]